MPKMFRPMKRDDDGQPITGTNSKELGVRIPPNKFADVDVNEDGTVELNGRGMSVAADWKGLKPHLIPKRLKSIVSGAVGSNSLSIYCLGEGEFSEGGIDDHLALALKPQSTRNGNVVPINQILLDKFLSYLAATRDRWMVAEND